MSTSARNAYHELVPYLHDHVDNCVYKSGHPGCVCNGRRWEKCPAFYCRTPSGLARPKRRFNTHAMPAWEHDVNCIYLIEQMGSAAPAHPGCTCDSGNDPTCPAAPCTLESQSTAVQGERATDQLVFPPAAVKCVPPPLVIDDDDDDCYECNTDDYGDDGDDSDGRHPGETPFVVLLFFETSKPDTVAVFDGYTHPDVDTCRIVSSKTTLEPTVVLFEYMASREAYGEVTNNLERHLAAVPRAKLMGYRLHHDITMDELYNEIVGEGRVSSLKEQYEVALAQAK